MKVTTKSKCIKLFKAGVGPSEAAHRLNITQASASRYMVAWRKTQGADAVHSPKKAIMIHQFLQDRSGLHIYETCAYKGDGSLGHCATAFKPYAAKHITRAKADGDWLELIRRLVLLPDLWDVIDVDGYEDPGRILTTGLFERIRDNGLLFVTWPSIQWYRWPLTRELALAHYNTEKPGLDNFREFVIRAALAYGCEAVELQATVYGQIRRAVFKIIKSRRDPASASSRKQTLNAFASRIPLITD